MPLQGLGKGRGDRKSSGRARGSSRGQSWGIPAAIDHGARERPQPAGRAALLRLPPSRFWASINSLQPLKEELQTKKNN